MRATLTRAGAACEACGGQAFWEASDVPLPWRDYHSLVCLSCGRVLEERWRVAEPETVEWPKRGRPRRGQSR